MSFLTEFKVGRKYKGAKVERTKRNSCRWALPTARPVSKYNFKLQLATSSPDDRRFICGSVKRKRLIVVVNGEKEVKV